MPVKCQASAGFDPGGRINYHFNGLSALLYAGGNRHRFRRQGFTGFGRIGVGALDNSAVGPVPFVQDNGVQVLFGAGVEYMTPIGIGLRAEGVTFDEDVQYAQLALMYRTGRKNEIRKPKLAKVPKPQPVIAAAAPPPPPPPAPAPAPVIVAAPNPCAGLNGVLEGVGFHTDSAGLTADSIRILDDVTRTLRTCDSLTIEVSAHTDSIGSEDYNQALSEKRAQSVVNYLSAQGLRRSRLNPLAFGESSPIDTNDTAEGRKRNRRVELYAR